MTGTTEDLGYESRDERPTLDQTTIWHLDRIEGDVADQEGRLAKIEVASQMQAELIARLGKDFHSSIIASAVVVRTILASMQDEVQESNAREAAIVALREVLGVNAAADIVEAIVRTPAVGPAIN